MRVKITLQSNCSKSVATKYHFLLQIGKFDYDNLNNLPYYTKMQTITIHSDHTNIYQNSQSGGSDFSNKSKYMRIRPEFLDLALLVQDRVDRFKKPTMKITTKNQQLHALELEVESRGTHEDHYKIQTELGTHDYENKDNGKVRLIKKKYLLNQRRS